MNITFGELTNTPLGTLSFAAGDRGLLRVVFVHLDELKAALEVEDSQPSLRGLQTIGVVLTEMHEYLQGKSNKFSVEIDWESVNGFQKEILRYITTIPYGEVTTYGQIARGIGKPDASRAVGRALGANPMPIVIPCHRVIGSDKTLNGYLNGLESKAFLLNLEGHQIKHNKINKKPQEKDLI